MCGIFASINYVLKDEQIRLILRDLKSRGPDASGVYTNVNLSTTLLHSRLKIVDLDDRSNQPFRVFGRYVCVYNGEIYNLAHLRNQLKKNGYKFKTSGDTEVLVLSYIHWGEEFLNRIDGMFSFVILDLKTKDLLFSRDRFGQKPLYYSFKKDKLVISSKLTSILKLSFLDNKLNYKYLNNFLTDGFVKAPNTIIEGISKAIPGEIIKYNLSSKIIKKKRIKISSSFPINISSTKSDHVNFLEKTLEKTVNLMVPQEVPSMFLLSGGLDSSILVGLASKNNKVNTITITHKNSQFDESKYARKIANYFQTNHYEVEIDKIDPITLIDELYDEPIIDSSLIPNILIFKNIPREIKVTIGGDGADELFGGYNHYNRIYKLYKTINQLGTFASLIPISILSQSFKNNIKVMKWISAIKDIKLGLCPSVQQYLTHSQLFKIFNQNIDIQQKKKLPFSKENILKKDIDGYLANDILVKLDYASMFSSKEARSPFLTNEVSNYAIKHCSPDLKFDSLDKKILLKSLGNKILPKGFDFQRKQGFEIDINSLVYSNNFKNIFNEILNCKSGLFNKVELQKLYSSKPKINSEFIFNFCCFQRWLNFNKISL